MMGVRVGHHGGMGGLPPCAAPLQLRAMVVVVVVVVGMGGAWGLGGAVPCGS